MNAQQALECLDYLDANEPFDFSDLAMSVALEATYPTPETWLTTLGTMRTVLETERAQTSWMATAMTTMTR